ncbi:MAG: class I poly(R)-hydroxyalkanoic acid synthase [Alphaproteobacteria bacterium]|nr:class I poly(R)-hydroxyalkanoic acid synthase [Alphaproteobacteria bacterium]
MTLADDDQKPRPTRKLAKSLDAIAALRIAMQQRLDEAQKEAQQPPPAPEPEPIAEPVPELLPEPACKSPPEPPPILKAAEPPPKIEAAPEPEIKPEPAPSAERKIYESTEWPQAMFRIVERSQKLIQDYLERQKDNALDIPAFNPMRITEAFMELTNRLLKDPERFTDAQIALWQGYVKIWQRAVARMQGKTAAPVVTPEPSDKRFKDKDWQNLWLFDYIKQSYLLTAQWVHGLVRQEAERFDPKLAHKIDFYTDQLLDAMSPSNFWMTNPEVLRATLESGGGNLIKGFEHLLEDLERGHGRLHISMSDPRAFKVGENLATTPGKVIYQNHLMQLIQYAPLTENVHQVPILIIPPWINKYYILDLREKNSLIRYLVEQGHTVFCISWVNPDERHAKVNFDDYMSDGTLAAMREIGRTTGEKDINIIGYCIGGTLLAASLAYLNALPEKPSDLPSVKSATYLVALTDFAEAGDLSVFIDEDQVAAIEARMTKQGYLDAASMAMTFNFLRANDLVWSFVINNYLLGREPFPFDILYWNSDSTNLPAAMQSFYLRKMYMENKLVEPNGLSMKGVPVDLHSIDTPSFMLATREDHIAPWRSTYAATQLYRGPVKFVLSGSGHIAGVVNPPAAQKYGYWTNDTNPPQADDWFKGAREHKGSWWPEWVKWLAQYAGEGVPVRDIKDGLENAPGSYVRVRAV